MKKKLFTTAILVGIIAVCFAFVAGISGKWVGTVNVSGNEYPLTYTFKADSGKLSGSAENPQGESPITDGKLNGDKFTFSVSVGGLDVPHVGTYYPAGDSIGMDIDYNGMKLHSTLKRDK